MDVGKLGPVNVCCGAYPGHRDHCTGYTPEPAAASGASGGGVIARPPRKHDCAPGWTTKTGSDGRPYSIPPSSWDYPKGTVWECACGKTWVSQGAPRPNSPGFTWWRREHWWSRRRRMRA